MGNATGQRADAFHALGLEELEFDFFSFRNVSVDGQDGLGILVLVPNQGPPGLDREDLAVFRHLPDFSEGFALLKKEIMRLLENFRISAK
jgi:hypothetical protein